MNYGILFFYTFCGGILTGVCLVAIAIKYFHYRQQVAFEARMDRIYGPRKPPTDLQFEKLRRKGKA